ncbi:hypothetical protein O181_002166 [Austropuccinia psidii MF-1]|uniref:Uncharacterized protein n=1 Tax=Austropuccinia psidii MF-1 TaxID=1389203 RepID=A0A9Q3BBG3_9BASI|nr:hypothetical protein [Austropuccinia psidii MF-1]
MTLLNTNVLDELISKVCKLPGSGQITNLHEAGSTKDGGTIGCTKHPRVAAITPTSCHSSNSSDDVMVRTKPVSVHHQNDLNDDATIVPPLDFMVRTKPKIDHHEDNNNPTNHKRKLTQSQRQHLHDSKQIMLQLGHSTSEYKKFSTILIDKKAANA